MLEKHYIETTTVYGRKTMADISLTASMRSNLLSLHPKFDGYDTRALGNRKKSKFSD